MIQEKLLPRSAPEAQGIESAAILAFVDAVEQGEAGLHSLMLLRHGHVVAEGWWGPYAPERPHMLFSLSKSFCSTAAGLAIAEGRLSLDDTVVSFFPDRAPAAVGENLAAMRVRHLLSMSTGHDQDAMGGTIGAADGDWVKAFLSLPVEHTPGTHFVYNSAATYMVSAIVQQVTGMRVVDYLAPRLFEPLGISGATWETCPRGIDTGGWGLSVKTEDIARFGQLYLQRGEWNGRRLLPESWVADATRKHISNGDPETGNDWNQGYGFQFWRCRHGAYRGDGAFGQYCVVLPEADAVVAITSGTRDMQAVLDLLWKHLLPAFGATSLPVDAAAEAALRARLAGLQVPAATGDGAAPTAAPYEGKTYRFAENDEGLASLSLEMAGHGGVLTVAGSEKTYHIPFSIGGWGDASAVYVPSVSPREQPVAASGAWTDDGALTLRLCLCETPFIIDVVLRFEGDRVQMGRRVNVGFGPTDRPTLEGNA